VTQSPFLEVSTLVSKPRNRHHQQVWPWPRNTKRREQPSKLPHLHSQNRLTRTQWWVCRWTRSRVSISHQVPQIKPCESGISMRLSARQPIETFTQTKFRLYAGIALMSKSCSQAATTVSLMSWMLETLAQPSALDYRRTSTWILRVHSGTPQASTTLL